MPDGALDAQQVRPLLPSGPGSTVIVSSRRRLAGLDATGRISLEPLPDRDGLRLLGSLVGTDRVEREPDTARELVRLCDGCRSPCGSRGSGSRHDPSGPWRTGWAEWPTTGTDSRS
ncbi:XRE family transcriptional regulator [Streptomyces sp. W007]|nr:XRE family transcriptional regulator [Streptomyces sp. W007]